MKNPRPVFSPRLEPSEYEGCLLNVGIGQPECCHLAIDVSIVKFAIFHNIHMAKTHFVLKFGVEKIVNFFLSDIDFILSTHCVIFMHAKSVRVNNFHSENTAVSLFLF